MRPVDPHRGRERRPSGPADAPPASATGAPRPDATPGASQSPQDVATRPGGHSGDLAAIARRHRPRPPTEHVEQVALCYQVRTHLWRYPDLASFAAIPNQGGGRPGSGHFVRAMQMKAEGLAPGYPDTLLDVARGGWHGLRIEMKRAAYWSAKLARPTKEGEPTAEQDVWLRRLTRNGYLCWVAWGWEPAWAILQWYLTLDDYVIMPEIPHARVYTLPPGLSRTELSHAR